MNASAVRPLDAPAYAEYGTIRSVVEPAGHIFGLNDLLTGAHAHAIGLTLVTDNVREFNRIPGITIEN